MTDFRNIFWKLRGVGFDPQTANFEAKFHPTTWRKVFRDSDKRFETELAKKRGRCRVCGITVLGLSRFCDSHKFTQKSGFDPHEFNFGGNDEKDLFV